MKIMYDAMMLDVGGTFVKYGAMQNGSFCLKGQFDIRQDGTAEEIQQPVVHFLSAHPASKVVICMPGPAQYKTGTSLMEHKFSAIRGVALKPWLERSLPGTEVLFLHDGVAFVLGEMMYGGLRDCSCGAGIMLGTGLGFGLCRQGKMLIRTVGSPAHPLWNAPYLDGICENYVSGRGMRRRWKAISRQEQDVHEIALLARSGNDQALALFYDTGKMLGEMLCHHLVNWPVEKISIGGQIARSWDLLADGFENACSIPAHQAQHLDDAALWGNYAYAQHGDALLEVIQS